MTKIAIHTPTQEEFNKLMSHYGSNKGWKWSDGKNPEIYLSDRAKYREKTCVPFCDVYFYGHLPRYEKNGYTILTFDEMLEYEKTGKLPSEERKPKTGEWVEVRDRDNSDWEIRMFVINRGNFYYCESVDSNPAILVEWEQIRPHSPKELTHKEIEEKLGHPFIYKQE